MGGLQHNIRETNSRLTWWVGTTLCKQNYNKTCKLHAYKVYVTKVEAKGPAEDRKGSAGVSKK